MEMETLNNAIANYLITSTALGICVTLPLMIERIYIILPTFWYKHTPLNKPASVIIVIITAVATLPVTVLFWIGWLCLKKEKRP